MRHFKKTEIKGNLELSWNYLLCIPMSRKSQGNKLAIPRTIFINSSMVVHKVVFPFVANLSGHSFSCLPMSGKSQGKNLAIRCSIFINSSAVVDKVVFPFVVNICVVYHIS